MNLPPSFQFKTLRGLLVAAASVPAFAGTPARLCDVATERPAVAGAPRAADVCMRSLRPRPVNDRDPHDTLAAIRGFHATWLEWTYGGTPAFVRQVKDLGVVFGGAASAGSYLGTAPADAWNVVDLEGRRLVAPWMRAWKKPNPWGCANNPEFRTGHLRFVTAAVDAGADVLQRDEPGQNLLAARWGGCFCDFCMKSFSAWLGTNAEAGVLARSGVTDTAGFDYRAYLRAKGAPAGDAFAKWAGDELKACFLRFQADSTVAFHAWWRAELNRHAGRPVPVSCNNGGRDWTEIERGFDYAIGELSAANARPERLLAAMRKAEALGCSQTVTMPLYKEGEHETPAWIRHTRQTLATVYAAGGHIEMPWDTYLPTPDARRYFGDPARYADLTAFVRGMKPVLEGRGDAFATGKGIEDNRWPVARAPVRVSADAAEGVYAFIRAAPGRPAAAVAVHLVDWRDEPRPFRIALRPDAFFAGDMMRVRLCTPVSPHDGAAHRGAFETRDYGPLVRERALAPEADGSFSIPALAPWGILVVRPGSALRQVRLVPGMKRLEAERLIAEAAGVPSTYDLYAMDTSGEIHYRDDTTVLVVRYRPGTPAPLVAVPGGGAQHLPPVDGEVLSWDLQPRMEGKPSPP